MRIAIVGGTGKEGRGLARRWARAGHRVILGSRDAARARERAQELGVDGGDNDQAVREAELVVLAVPYQAHASTLAALREVLADRILVDITVPLRPPVTQVHLPEGGSAALEAQALLGPRVRVAATLHHVGSAALADADRPLEGDVLVCADDEGARETVMRLVADLGARALDAGPLANAVALESLTPVLLHLNRRYRASAAGIKITNC